MEELTIAPETKPKRFRSFKCVICDATNKTVKEVICPLTLKYDGIEEKVYMCEKCLKEIIEDKEEWD